MEAGEDIKKCNIELKDIVSRNEKTSVNSEIVTTDIKEEVIDSEEKESAITERSPTLNTLSLGGKQVFVHVHRIGDKMSMISLLPNESRTNIQSKNVQMKSVKVRTIISKANKSVVNNVYLPSVDVNQPSSSKTAPQANVSEVAENKCTKVRLNDSVNWSKRDVARSSNLTSSLQVSKPSSKWKCKHCELMCRTRKELLLHQKSHKWQCEICKKKFLNAKTFRQHKKAHKLALTADSPECQICKLDCGTTEGLDRHVFSSHKRHKHHRRYRERCENRVRERRACEICGGMVYFIERHKKLCHGPVRIKVPNKYQHLITEEELMRFVVWKPITPAAEDINATKSSD